MRVLLLVFVLAIPAFAQTPFVSQAFEAGNVAAQEKRYENAIEKYRTTAMFAETERLSDSFLAKIHFNIGVCLYQLKRADEAVAEYTEAIKLSKREYQKAFYALGMAQKDLENWREAENSLRDALKIEKSDGEAWFDLALIRLERKDFTAAQKAFENAVKYKSASAADAHNNLGVIAAFENDWNSAEREFQTALRESNGKSVEAQGNLRFCKFYRQNYKSEDLLAKLEFSQTSKRGE